MNNITIVKAVTLIQWFFYKKSPAIQAGDLLHYAML